MKGYEDMENDSDRFTQELITIEVPDDLGMFIDDDGEECYIKEIKLTIEEFSQLSKIFYGKVNV